MTGQYRIALLPGADPQAFVEHMQNEVFRDAGGLQLTRITRAFDHRLLAGSMRQYVWQVTVDLVTDAGYDFAQNAEHVQASVAAFGVLIHIEAFTHVASG
jgi:hypothetical protein